MKYITKNRFFILLLAKASLMLHGEEMLPKLTHYGGEGRTLRSH